MKRLPLLLMSLFAALACSAATNVVIVGDNFQSRIDAASPGDTLVVQAGVYSGTIDFTKPLTIVKSGTNALQFGGSCVISTTGRVTISQSAFAGSLTLTTNGSVVFSKSSCSAVVVLNGGNFHGVDSQMSSLTATNGQIVAKRCSISGGIVLSNSDFDGLRVSTTSVTGACPTNALKRFVLVQSTLTRPLSLAGYQCYLGYSSFSLPEKWNSLITLTDCHSTAVGNIAVVTRVTLGVSHAFGVVRGSLKAYNNRLYLYGDNWDQNYFRIYGFNLTTASGEIVNNSIRIAGASAYYIGGEVTGINVVSGGGPVKVRANAVRLLYGNDPANLITTGVRQDGTQIVECAYNCIGVDFPPELVGVLGVGNIFATPSFESTYNLALTPENQMYKLLPGSPCINAGPPDAIYRDGDLSRNDIGSSGGPVWNPQNYTNSMPMVSFLMTSNQTVLKGLQATIPINAAATAGH